MYHFVTRFVPIFDRFLTMILKTYLIQSFFLQCWIIYHFWNSFLTSFILSYSNLWSHIHDYFLIIFLLFNSLFDNFVITFLYKLVFKSWKLTKIRVDPSLQTWSFHLLTHLLQCLSRSSLKSWTILSMSFRNIIHSGANPPSTRIWFILWVVKSS